MVAWGVLLALMVVASVTDLARHKIYNWTTYPGILLALALNAAVPKLASQSHWGDWGYIGLHDSLLGFLLCGFLMLVCFVFFRVGGGDVKLLAMLGAFMGPQQGIEAVLWTFVLGGGMALIVLIWRVGPWRLAVRAVRQLLWAFRVRGWPGLTAEEKAQLQPPLFLAPSALAAVLIVHYRWL